MLCGENKLKNFKIKTTPSCAFSCHFRKMNWNQESQNQGSFTILSLTQFSTSNYIILLMSHYLFLINH